jgi:hypothetical protein
LWNKIVHIYYQHRQRLWPVTSQTCLPVREDAPWQQYLNCLNYSQNLVMSPTGARCQDGLTDGLSDWLTDWLTDWWTKWLTGWRTEWLTDRLSDWLTDWMTDWLTDGLSDWLADGLSDWLTDWLTDRPTERQPEGKSASDWLVKQMHSTVPRMRWWTVAKGPRLCRSASCFLLPLSAAIKVSAPSRLPWHINDQIYCVGLIVLCY